MKTLLATLFATVCLAQEGGAPKGSLVLIGGGDDRGTGIMETFINKAGGLGGKFIVVPTANGNLNPDGSPKAYDEESVLAPWKRGFGLKNIRMLHTHDRAIADTEAFVKDLREATGVWFEGGRQFHIIDSYRGTLTERQFRNVFERGGVLGGTSAGATALGDYLVRGAIAGPEIVMATEPEHQDGLKLLKGVAIDQHINTRKRWDDLGQVIQKFPHLLGIGLSEGTAIVVTEDRMEVWGKWKVAIHDAKHPYKPWEKPYYVLSAGDVFNLATRQVEVTGAGPQPRPRLIGAAPDR
jgi:cyanophycinase